MNDREGPMTRREMLEGQWRATGNEPAEMLMYECPQFWPWSMRYLWQWWGELARGRPVGMEIGRFAYSEIEAWARLTSRAITRWELRVLFDIDELYLQAQKRQSDADSERSQQPAGPAERHPQGSASHQQERRPRT